MTGSRNLSRRGMLGGLSALAGIAAIRPARGQAQTRTLEDFPISAIPTTAQAPVFLAVKRGYFREQGLNADLHLFDSGNNVLLAVASGSVKAGTIAFSSAVYNIAAKGGIKLIAGYNRSVPHFHDDGIVATNAAWDAGLRTLKDLKGRRVGLTTTGGPSYYELARIAEINGYTIDDVDVVPLQSFGNIVAAFKGNQIDACNIGSPFSGQLEAQHYGHVLAWTSDVVPQQFSGVITTPAMIEHDRAGLEKYLKALSRGAQDYGRAFNQIDAASHFVKGQGYDAALAIVADTLQVPADKLGDDWAYIDPGLTLDEADLARQIDFWKSRKLIDPSLSAGEIVDRSFGYVK